MSPRGTSNTNDRGSAESRRARKAWLMDTFQANVDAVVIMGMDGTETLIEVPPGWGEKACRCYRCGCLLTNCTVTVDRIIPGAQGGTYRRNNIRPACGNCNSVTGTQLRESMRKKRELVST